MEKIKIKFEDNIAETLIIPLWMRAKESKRKDALLHDPYSEALVEKIDYDFSKFNDDPKSQVGIALRSRYLDKVVKEFIDNNDNPVVVLGGCGLDPRISRVNASKQFVCYELDIPEVIEYRKNLLPHKDNDILLPTSLFDTAWMDELKEKHPDAQFLFVVEGVLIYFSESTVKQFFVDVATRFPSSRIYIERNGKMVANNTKHHTSVKKTKAMFDWGCDDPHIVESWHDNIQLISEYYFMKDAPLRCGFMGMVAKLFFWRMCGIWGFQL